MTDAKRTMAGVPLLTTTIDGCQENCSMNVAARQDIDLAAFTRFAVQEFVPPGADDQRLPTGVYADAKSQGLDFEHVAGRYVGNIHLDAKMGK